MIDSYGCSDTVSYFLDEPSPIVSSFTTSDYNGYNVSCNGDSNAYIDFSISGSVPPYLFQWNNTNDQDENSYNDDIKEKRDRWIESLKKDIYVNEAMNLLRDLSSLKSNEILSQINTD